MINYSTYFLNISLIYLFYSISIPTTNIEIISEIFLPFTLFLPSNPSSTPITHPSFVMLTRVNTLKIILSESFSVLVGKNNIHVAYDIFGLTFTTLLRFYVYYAIFLLFTNNSQIDKNVLRFVLQPYPCIILGIGIKCKCKCKCKM